MCEDECDCVKPCVGCSKEELPSEKETRLRQLEGAGIILLDHFLREHCADEDESVEVRTRIGRQISRPDGQESKH